MLETTIPAAIKIKNKKVGLRSLCKDVHFHAKFHWQMIFGFGLFLVFSGKCIFITDGQKDGPPSPLLLENPQYFST